MNFKKMTVRKETSTRGGGVEISLTSIGFKGHKMSAYQNYLGGGMLGAIQVNDTIRSQESNVMLQLQYVDRFGELDSIGKELMKYYHNLTRDYRDEDDTFENIQKRATSAY